MREDYKQATAASVFGRELDAEVFTSPHSTLSHGRKCLRYREGQDHKRLDAKRYGSAKEEDEWLLILETSSAVMSRVESSHGGLGQVISPL